MTWRLRVLAGAHAGLLSLFYEDEEDQTDLLEYGLPSRRVQEILTRRFHDRYITDLGEEVSLAILRRAMRPYLVVKRSLRAALILGLLATPLLYGWIGGVLTQTAAYLVTRPLSWYNRGRGTRLSRVISGQDTGALLSDRRLRRALRARHASIPARTLRSEHWGMVLVSTLPVDEAVRDIASQLAEEYDGSVADLIETSRALAG